MALQTLAWEDVSELVSAKETRVAFSDVTGNWLAALHSIAQTGEQLILRFTKSGTDSPETLTLPIAENYTTTPTQPINGGDRVVTPARRIGDQLIFFLTDHGRFSIDYR